MKNLNNRHTQGNMTPREHNSMDCGSYSSSNVGCRIKYRDDNVQDYEKEWSNNRPYNHPVKSSDTPTHWSGRRTNEEEKTSKGHSLEGIIDSKGSSFGKPNRRVRLPQSGAVSPKRRSNKLICTTNAPNSDNSYNTPSSNNSSSPSQSNKKEFNVKELSSEGRNSKNRNGKDNINKVKSSLGTVQSSYSVSSNKSEKSNTKEPWVKRNYNIEIEFSESRPGDLYIIETLMMEAMLAHNEIVRRVNIGENPYNIDISSLREIIYFTKNGMIQHAHLHYIADIQLANLLSETQELMRKLTESRGLTMEQIHLNPLSQMRFLNFRRLGQTHWIDFNKKQIRLLGMPVALNVKGLELLENIPSIRIGSMRLLRTNQGFALSVQCFIPEKDMDEFNSQVVSSFTTKTIVEEEEVKDESRDRGVEVNEQNNCLDNSLIEALREKYNRNKDLEKYDNSVHFLKGIAS